MAEVLITLAIIGVIAALTIPNLMQSYRKNIAQTRLAHFYSAMNQAIKLSELENGDAANWEPVPNGSNEAAYEKKEKWFNKYILPYFVEVKEVDLGGQDRWYHIYFTDGGLLSIDPWTGSSFWEYYPLGLKYPDRYGIEIFCFKFDPKASAKFEPFKKKWNGTSDDLKYNSSYGCYTGSNHYFCGALLEANGWKFPDDYPYKF